MAIKLVGDKFPSVCCGHQRLECGASGSCTTLSAAEGGWPATSPPSSTGTRVEVPPTSSLQFLGLSLWTGTPWVPPCEGSWRWSQEGGLVLIGGIWGRRRSRMRAQQGGARIYIFVESKSFFSNGQSIFGYCVVLEKACRAKDLDDMKNSLFYSEI